MRIFLFSASKRKVICEDSKTTLSCPSNQVIKITQATYGRSNKRTCKNPNMKTTRCVTKKPLGISRKNCNGRKSCTVAANNRLYGDPCPGTYKYVTVTYSCKVKKTPKCLRRCHRQAKCIRGKCVCKSGYKGDGIRSCTNIKASSNWKCYHYTLANKIAMIMFGQKTICEKHGRIFTKGINNNYPGCGTCWCCQKPKGTPSDCKGKCHIHGTCERGRCRCKRGYTGDGINVCSKSCTCSASGDPHYRTFDGQVLHFMGTCKYTLSQYVNPSSRCRFHVQVKNENRGNTQVSFTRSVHVVVRKTKIDLLKNNVVKVDGIKIYLPYKTRYFSIIYSGRYVRLKTTCKVLITWDGNSAVTISVPSQFSRNLIGLCGNCNGIKDDFRTKDGLDVRTKPDKFTLIGESYLIREGTSKKCGVTTPPDPCTSALRNKANRNSACGQLNPANPSSSFKDCSQVDTALVQDIYNTCVYDYCAYSDPPRYMKYNCLRSCLKA
ncbi:Hypothetical predicted protein [Mytilus galloprovincialis]|uniref:VWFD domain-containing protein n=1 Tax=Mytilus galloprovincialis TaxID=29158 RepID=A0A8B6ECZ3_MYTGA|nr:Hypothetical predicted protein [Mytilus galloprovincialis]